MLIAQEKRKTNIAEYILYLWQVEDMLRACKFDKETIELNLVNRFNVEKDRKSEIAAWYNNLSLMMVNEHLKEKGHLQVIKNLIADLNEFHLKLIITHKDPEYVQLYRNNCDNIREFILKSGESTENEIEACLNALYGILLLKLKNTEISDWTKNTVEQFGKMIARLSARYIQFENDEFEF